MSLKIFEDLVQGRQLLRRARRGIVTAPVVGQLITPSTVKPAKNDRSRANQLTGEVQG